MLKTTVTKRPATIEHAFNVLLSQFPLSSTSFLIFMRIHEDVPWSFAIFVGEMKEALWHGVHYVLYSLRPKETMKTTITKE